MITTQIEPQRGSCRGAGTLQFYVFREQLSLARASVGCVFCALWVRAQRAGTADMSAECKFVCVLCFVLQILPACGSPWETDLFRGVKLTHGDAISMGRESESKALRVRRCV